MSCFQKFAKFILIFINTVFFILGAAVIGMAVYLKQSQVSWFNSNGQAVFNDAGLYATMIFGGVIMAISLAGCVGAMKGAEGCGKCFLFLYSATVLLVILVQLIVAILILVLAGQLGDFGKNAKVERAATEFDKKVEGVVNQTYTTCCVDPKGKTDDVCQDVVLKITSCKSGENQFKQDLYQWVSDNMSKVSVGFIIIGAIEILGLFMGCHLMCWGKAPEPQKPLAQQAPQQTHGGDLAYGGTNAYPPPHSSYA